MNAQSETALLYGMQSKRQKFMPYVNRSRAKRKVLRTLARRGRNVRRSWQRHTIRSGTYEASATTDKSLLRPFVQKQNVFIRSIKIR